MCQIRWVFLALSTAVAMAACQRNDTSPVPEMTQAERLAAVDSVAAAIERRLGELDRDTSIVFGLSTEGALVEGHYSGHSLSRLRATFLGEMGRATRTYYYNPQLALVVRDDIHYDRPLSGRARDSTRSRYYFDAGVLIGATSTGKQPSSVPADLLTDEQRLRALLDSATRATKFTAAGVSYSDVQRFLELLQLSLSRNDTAAVANLVSLPLQVHREQDTDSITTRAELLSRFGEVFPDTVRDVILGARPRTLFANWKGIMLGRGEVWIGAICEEPSSRICPIRIIAVNQPK